MCMRGVSGGWELAEQQILDRRGDSFIQAYRRQTIMHARRDSNKLAEEGNAVTNRAEAPIAARIRRKSMSPYMTNTQSARLDSDESKKHAGNACKQDPEERGTRKSSSTCRYEVSRCPPTT